MFVVVHVAFLCCVFVCVCCVCCMCAVSVRLLLFVYMCVLRSPGVRGDVLSDAFENTVCVCLMCDVCVMLVLEKYLCDVVSC